MSPEVIKLLSVLATSTPVTETRAETIEATEAVKTAKAIETVKTVGTAKVGEDDNKSKSDCPNLARVPCIRYTITFQKKSVPISALFDSGSEVNAIHPTFAQELGLPIRTTDIGAQKIDGTILDTFKIVVVAFSVTNKANQVRFLKDTFLVANVSPEVIFGMPFVSLSGVDVDFSGWELCWKTYTTEEALPTTRRVALMDKKEFAAVALDSESETLVVHVASLSSNASPSSSPLEFDVHLSRKPQVSGLIAEEAPTKVSVEYSDFADVFSLGLASELSEHPGINDHTIELVNSQQPPYGPIYSLRPVELKTLKAYIKTNLANEFIQPSKSPARAPILFERKSDSLLRLCVNYRGLNNLTIKNRYPLLLIRELLDKLERVKRFTQLDLTSTYHRMRIREGDEWKTAFRTRYGHFEYQVMPFGLTNAPASFQGYINKILAEKLDIFVIVYLDDILIYTEDDGDDHVAAVQ